jgi:hypothetical protein
VDEQEIVLCGDLHEVQEHFHALGWTDGLPVIPPTREAVAQFLAFTSRDEKESIGQALPSKAEATVWSVAVNGVMSGCRPEYMPVLVGVAEALLDPRFKLQDSGSTSGWEPLVIVSGPAVRELDFNYTTGAMRPGRRANSTVGRFARLFMRNVAGFLTPPGNTDKGTIGMNFHVALAESVEAVAEIGWPGFGVDQGFDPEDTVVTLQSILSVTPPMDAKGDNPYTILETIGQVFGGGAAASPWLSAAYNVGQWYPLVVMTPLAASILAKGGFDKPAIRSYLHDNALISAREFERLHYWSTGQHDFAGFRNSVLADIAKQSPGFDTAAHKGDAADRPAIPVFPFEDGIGIVVAGDPLFCQARGYLNNQGQGARVSRRVEPRPV